MAQVTHLRNTGSVIPLLMPHPLLRAQTKQAPSAERAWERILPCAVLQTVYTLSLSYIKINPALLLSFHSVLWTRSSFICTCEEENTIFT